MAKINPNQIRRVLRAPETILLADPDFPDVPVSLTLRRIDPLEIEKAMEVAGDLALKHVHGGFWDPVREIVVKEPEAYVCDDGETLTLTETALQAGCRVAAMQACPPEDRYTPLELLELSAKMPAIYVPMIQAAQRIQSPKAATGDATNPSEPSSTSPPST